MKISNLKSRINTKPKFPNVQNRKEARTKDLAIQGFSLLCAYSLSPKAYDFDMESSTPNL
jgi:hypothetical protein